MKLYELWKSVETEFYIIKSKLYMGHFSVKTLFMPSLICLGCLTVPKIWPRGQNKKKLKLYELWKTVETEFYIIKSKLYLGHFQ